MTEHNTEILDRDIERPREWWEEWVEEVRREVEG